MSKRVLLEYDLSSANHAGLPDYLFYCPGCKCSHGVWTSRPNSTGAKWGFNGDLEKPTFSPSILITYEEIGGGLPKDRPAVCHSFVRDGRIEFLGDCTHELAGQAVEMREVDL